MGSATIRRWDLVYQGTVFHKVGVCNYKTVGFGRLVGWGRRGHGFGQKGEEGVQGRDVAQVN